MVMLRGNGAKILHTKKSNKIPLSTKSDVCMLPPSISNEALPYRQFAPEKEILVKMPLSVMNDRLERTKYRGEDGRKKKAEDGEGREDGE